MSGFKVKFLLVLYILLISNYQVSGINIDASAADSFINAPDNVNVLTTYEIIVWVADTNNDSLNVDVTLSVTDGKFESNGLTSISGTSSGGVSGGEYTVNWISPSISFLEVDRTVSFTADIDGDSALVIKDITLTHETNRAIVASEISIPSLIISGTSIDVSTLVKDFNDDVTEGIQVSYISDDGNFTDPTGISNVDGFYNTTFNAPVVHPTLIELNFTISVLIQASDDVNVTLTKDVSIRLTDATSLTVTVEHETDVYTGDDSEISFKVMAGTSPAYGADITLTAADGDFPNDTPLIALIVNETGYAITTWTAPIVEQNGTYNFAYDISYLLDLIDTGEFDIDVFFTVKDAKLEFDITHTSIKQNQTNEITISVSELISSDKIKEIDVLFSTGTGMWEESGTEDYLGTTDSNGNVTATFNATNAILIFEQQTIVIMISLSSARYNLLTIEFNFTLIRVPPIFGYMVSPAVSNITEGDTVLIDLHAFQNMIDYYNATFALYASAGLFSNDDTTFRDKTDINGELVVEWFSSSIANLTESMTVYITVELVNSGLDTLVIEINISPLGASSNTTPTGDGSNIFTDNPALWAGIIGAVVAIGAGAFFISKKFK